MIEEYRQNVCRGAAFMDREYPGWERQVDVSILDINDPRSCICGQVIPEGYTKTMELHFGHLFDSNDKFNDEISLSIQRHGFTGGWHSDYWVELIKERFDSGILSDTFAE
jgi:hypothetical protein